MHAMLAAWFNKPQSVQPKIIKYKTAKRYQYIHQHVKSQVHPGGGGVILSNCPYLTLHQPTHSTHPS